MSYYNPNAKGLDQWFADKSRRKGCDETSINYILKFREILDGLGKNASICYFLVTKLNIDRLRQMMHSLAKQRKLYKLACIELREYRIDPKWIKTFDNAVRRGNTRIEYTSLIIKENIRLTEYFPFFNSGGFDRLTDFNLTYSDDFSTPLDKLMPEIEAYNEEHAAEITDYMLSIKDELETREKYHNDILMAEKEAKAKAREDKKAQRDFDKETAKMVHEAEVRDRAIERSFEHHYKNAERMKQWNAEIERVVKEKAAEKERLERLAREKEAQIDQSLIKKAAFHLRYAHNDLVINI